jgi:DNA-binding NarL/FixJ family response regulator
LSELVRAVLTLAQGRRYLSASISQQVADSFTREPLTARESQVLGLLAEGLCNKMIGRQLAIQAGTVKSHVKGILTKLEAASRTQAVSIAARRGLVTQRLHRSGIGSQLHPVQRHAQVH